MRAFLSLVFSIAFALPALAVCNGPGFDAWLTDAERAELDALVADTAYGDAILWQATRGDTTLDIVGTMHLPDPRLDPIMARVLPLLDQADLLLVEATLDDQVAMQDHITRNPALYVITEGPSLIDRVDPDTWAAISDAAEARGMGAFMVARFQPWFLSLTLSMPPCATAAMAAGQGGLDNTLMQQAVGRVETRPLEDWHTMLDWIMSGTFEQQLDALKLSLVAPDVQDALIASMLDGYFDGSPAYAWHVNRFGVRFVPGLDAEAYAAEFAVMEEQLLHDRNRNWIPVIEDAARTHDRILIAFGAAHLIGDKGVLNLLAENGWTVTPLD